MEPNRNERWWGDMMNRTKITEAPARALVHVDGRGADVRKASPPHSPSLPLKRSSIDDSLSAIGGITFDIYLNNESSRHNVPAAVWT